MQNQSPSTAVLVFVRDEQEEARLKSFHAGLGLRGRLQVVRAFNRHIAAVTRQSGLPVFLVKGAQQVGNSFGERFANAVESIFEAGYDHVIAVGNDCLSLTSRHLQRIEALLSNGTPMVLGPAKDGGVYTLGIQKAVYQRNTFIQLPWQTEQVFTALIHYAQQQNADCYCLAQATDIDDEVSFQSVLSSLPVQSNIYSVLKNIIHNVGIQPIANLPFIIAPFSAIALLRAPPVY